MRLKPSGARSGFVVVPLAVALWVALMILGVLLWQKTPPAGYVPAKGVGPGQIGSVILAVLYGGFWVWVVGGLAEKKGKTAANVTAVIAIGFAAVMMGLSFAGLSADQRKLAKNAQGAGAVAQQSTSGSSGGSGGTGSPADQGMRRMADQLARQNQPGIGRPTPASEPSPSSVPTGAAPASGSGVGGAVVTQPKEHAEVKPTSAAFERELLEQINALVAQADEIVPVLARPVAHDLRDVRSRIDRVEAMKVLAEPLSKRLGDAIDELKGRLLAAGVPESEAFHQSILWNNKFGAASRGFAAGDYARLGERALEELSVLRDEFGNWTLNAKGELVCKDVELKQRMNTARFFVSTEAERHSDMQKRLRGS